MGSLSLLQGDLPNPGIEPRYPTLQVNSLPAEPPEKPKNSSVGTLSLLQGIFLTQELNWGFLYCRWILYPLSYQESHRMLNMPLLYLQGKILEKAVAPHSSTLAWKIPWMEEPGRVQSMRSLRVGHD